MQALRNFRVGRRLGARTPSKNVPNAGPKHPQSYPRGAQEHSGPSQESPKSLPKPPLERSWGTLWRHKSLLGWFWKPQAFILEPQGPHFFHFACIFEPLFSLLFSLKFSLLHLFSLLVCPFYLVFSLLSSLFSLLSSLFSLRSSVFPAARTTSFSCFLSLTMFETSFQNSKLTVSIFSGAARMRAALK